MAELRVPGLLQSTVGLRGRMARAGERLVAAAGSLRRAGVRGCGAARASRSRFAGRLVLALSGLFLLASAHAQILSSRLWPAREYTRLTLESKERLEYTI